MNITTGTAHSSTWQLAITIFELQNASHARTRYQSAINNAGFHCPPTNCNFEVICEMKSVIVNSRCGFPGNGTWWVTAKAFVTSNTWRWRGRKRTRKLHGWEWVLQLNKKRVHADHWRRGTIWFFVSIRFRLFPPTIRHFSCWGETRQQ